MNIYYKSLMCFLLFNLLVACSSSFNIKDGSPKSQLDVNISNLGQKTGLSSVFSGKGYRLELHSYDIEKCELIDRVVRVNPFDLEESIEIPANKPLHLFYFYTSTDAYGTKFTKGTCAGPIGFLPEANHKYKFDFKLQPARCVIKIRDMTNQNISPPMVRIPESCLKKRHAIQ